MNTVITPSKSVSHGLPRQTVTGKPIASKSVIIGAYMDAARKMWRMQCHTNREIRAYAWKVAEGYHERAAECAGYMQNLTSLEALEYATAVTLSTQQMQCCTIHNDTMYVQRDGRFGHKVWNVDFDGNRTNCAGWVCHGGIVEDTRIGETCTVDYVIGSTYTAEDARADHADAIAEMPELAGMIK